MQVATRLSGGVGSQALEHAVGLGTEFDRLGQHVVPLECRALHDAHDRLFGGQGEQFRLLPGLDQLFEVHG